MAFELGLIATALFLSNTGPIQCMPFSLEIEKGRLSLSWNYLDDTVAFEVRARVNPKSWIAFGASDYGEFSLADFCVFWTDSWGRQHFTDSFTDVGERLGIDEHQDCELQSINQTKVETTIRYLRKRTTCDVKDYQYEVRSLL